MGQLMKYTKRLSVRNHHIIKIPNDVGLNFLFRNITVFFTILSQPMKQTKVSACCHYMLDIKTAKNCKYNSYISIALTFQSVVV